jgi:hypothetical protein
VKAPPIILDSVRLAIEGENRHTLSDAKSRREIADAFAKRRPPIASSRVFDVYQGATPDSYVIFAHNSTKQFFHVHFVDGGLNGGADAKILKSIKPHILRAAEITVANHRAESRKTNEARS